MVKHHLFPDFCLFAILHLAPPGAVKAYTREQYSITCSRFTPGALDTMYAPLQKRVMVIRGAVELG